MRQGWGYLAEVAGLDRVQSVERRLVGHRERVEPPAPDVRLRVTLEELGPTFMKIGQLLSTRADLLAPEYRVELAKLQDSGPRLALEVVRDAVANELEGGVEGAFASFDLEPLAAGSIGQAHAAVLPDGTEVVVKLRRPGVVEEIEQDLEIIRNCAARASRRSEVMARYDLVGLADEFAQTLRAELDYLREGHNAERFATNFADDPDLQIPRVFWEQTTCRVITLEHIYGMKISDLPALDAAGVDRHGLAVRATRVIAKMVFEDGFFHADPHPGNFFIAPTGRIGLIDFGMVGTLDDALRDRLGRLLVATVRQDPDRLASALLALDAATAPVDRAQLREDLARMLARYSGRGLGAISLSTAIGEIVEIVRRHRLTLPRDLALLLKAFIMDEGLAAELDADFKLVQELTPYAYRHLATQFSPAALARRLERLGVDLAELSLDLPGQLHRFLEALPDGGFEVHLRTAELEPLIGRLERLGNRVAASVIAAALINGLAEVAAAARASSRNGRAGRRTAARAGLGAVGTLVAGLRERKR